MTELDSWLSADLRRTLAGADGPALASAALAAKAPALWNLRARAREAMIDQLRARELSAADSDALWLGWAGPLSADSRAELLIHDLARLERLLDDPMQAVRVLVVGAASDGAGQASAERLAEVAASPRFDGRLLFLASRDPAAVKLATQGVDLWLDTALDPPPDPAAADSEARAPSPRDWAMASGALLVSTHEDPRASWTVSSAEPFDDRSGRDAFDARELLTVLEREVVPSFYDWDAQAIPQAWIERVRRTMAGALGSL